MDKIQSLYDLYLSKGLITDQTSLETFSNASGDQINKLYELGSQNGLFNQVDANTFATAWGEKKKDESELPFVDGSSVSQGTTDFTPEEDDWEMTKKFKASGLTALGNFSRIPQYIDEAVRTALMSDEDLEQYNTLTATQRDQVFQLRMQSAAPLSPGLAIAAEGSKISNEYSQRSELITETMKKFDQSIGEDLIDVSDPSNIIRGAGRLASEAVGSIPSIIQAMIPYVGLASIAAGSAAGRSGELQRQGEDLSGKVIGNAAVYGVAEGLMEAVTKKIGSKLIKSFKGAPTDIVVQGTKDFFKAFAKDLGAEGLSEDATLLVQKAADALILGEEIDFNSLTTELIDTFLIGMAATGPLSGATQGVKVLQQNALKKRIEAKLVDSEYNDLTEAYDKDNMGDIDDTQFALADKTGRAFLDFQLQQKVAKGKITKEKAEETLKNFDEVASFNKELDGLNYEGDTRKEVVNLLREKRDLEKLVAGKDPALVKTQMEAINAINEKLGNIASPPKPKYVIDGKELTKEEFTKTIEETSKEDLSGMSITVDNDNETMSVVDSKMTKEEAPVTEEKTSQTVADVINRPVTLFELAGVQLQNPITGDLYVEGQQLVVEEANGNITELGNVDEMSSKTTSELGIDSTVSDVSVNPEGNIIVGDKAYTIQSDLPTDGIVYDADNNIIEVSIKDETGKPVMFKGQTAVDVGYQILLDKATSPEQAQFINEQLENDAEFQNEFTETTEPAQEEATEVPQQDPTTEPEAEPTVEPTRKIDFTTVKNKALQALSSIIPDVQVIIHDTEESYLQVVGNKDSRGAFLPETNTIHINSSTANEQTIAHEAFHALMLNKLKSDSEVAKRVESLLKAVESKAPAELKAYLKTFSANYDANIQSEEKLAEMFGILASGFPKLDAPAKLTVRNLLQYIQTKLGLKEFTDREAVEFMNTISNKVRTGKTILSEDVAILERRATIGGKMSNRFQANFKDVASGLEFVYDKNNEKFSDLEAKGFITKDRSSIDFDGDYVFLHQPDAAFSGEILKDGETIVEGKGGMYYPIKFHDKGYFWASTASAAEKMAADLNKVYDQNNGKILMALTSAPSDKLLSSTTMSNAVLDFFTSKAIDRKFKLNKADFNKAIVKAANQTMTVKKANGGTKIVGLGLKTRVSKDIKETLSDIKTKLGAENSSFADRKLFAQSLISNIADVIKQDAKATDQFADLFSVGIQNQYFKGVSKTGKKSISKANIIQAMSEMFTEPILKDGVDRNRGGQVYAILELNSKVEPVEATEHESYPKAIKAVDGDVKLHILRDRFNWNEMFEDPQTNQIVGKDREQNIYPSSSGVSTQGLRLNASNIKGKLQKAGVDFDAVRMIKQGIELGISDTSILESLKDMGYNPDSSYDLLQNYKEEFRKEGEAKDGVYVDSNNKLKNGIEKAYRMALSPRGFLPKSMMIAKEVLQGMIDSEVKIARNNIRLLERKLQKYNDQELKEIVGKIDAYIRGDITIELPSDLIDIASDMRNHVDDLSSKLIESGAIDSKEDIAKIRGNIGSYLNRSYKLFDKDNYAESIPQSVIDKAKARLKKDYRKLAEEESKKTGVDVNTILNRKVDAAIQNILKKDEANAFISAAKTGSKNLKSLKRKKDIPAEIRALMGEYGDPAFNYIQSVNKIESMVANQIFLNKMRKKGEGVFFFKERTGNATELIAPEGSDQYNPLNGYYTTPEIKKALEGQSGFKFTGSLEVLQKPYEGYLKGVGFVKKMKTIYSVGTQAKNIIGIVPVLISNGYVTDFESFKTAFKALNNDLRGKNDADLNAKMDEYLKSGIIGSSVVVSEIKSMMNKGETFEDAMIKRLAETDEKKLRYYAEHAWGNAKKIDKALITAYQTTDDFSKILGYEVEKKRYAKSKFGKEYSKLDSNQQQEINDIAAEIVKNNIPNYGRVGGLVKALKALPIAGTFISFHAEAIRTAYNTVDQAMREMQDPATRDIGVERMKGILAVSATATLLPVLFGLSSIGNSEEDEEEDSMKYARMFMPDWDKNSSVIIYDQPKDGKFSYISMSASDPYGAISQAVNAAMSGENMADSAVKALGELVSPFFEKDMILESLGKIWDVVKDGMNKKYNVSDSSLRFMAELGKLIAPGTYTSAMRIDDAYFKKDESAVKEAIGQMTGFKPRKIDIPKQAMFLSYKIKDQAAENKKAYTKVKRNFIQKKEGVTREDVKAEYMKINASQKEIYGELINMYKGAIYLGTPKVEVLKSMKAAGIPMYMIKGIAQGKIPDMSI